MGWRHDLGTAWRRGPRTIADVLIASWELAIANRAFRHLPPGRLALLSQAAEAADQDLSPQQRAVIERVAFAVPVMGLRVPWRSDCVVQALAARRWLARYRIAAALRIGVRKDGPSIAAHAWLTAGGRVVTGGDISDYAELPPARIRPGLFA